MAGAWNDNLSGVARGYGMWASNTNNWAVWVADGTNQYPVNGPAVALNVWTHLAATYDGTTLRLYVNGSLVGSAAVPYSPNTSNPFGIGAFKYPAAWNDFLPGSIDEVAVYSTALSAARIQAHYMAR